jgi:hypothetical protein
MQQQQWQAPSPATQHDEVAPSPSLRSAGLSPSRPPSTAVSTSTDALRELVASGHKMARRHHAWIKMAEMEQRAHGLNTDLTAVSHSWQNEHHRRYLTEQQRRKDGESRLAEQSAVFADTLAASNAASAAQISELKQGRDDLLDMVQASRGLEHERSQELAREQGRVAQLEAEVASLRVHLSAAEAAKETLAKRLHAADASDQEMGDHLATLRSMLADEQRAREAETAQLEAHLSDSESRAAELSRLCVALRHRQDAALTHSRTALANAQELRGVVAAARAASDMATDVGCRRQRQQVKRLAAAIGGGPRLSAFSVRSTLMLWRLEALSSTKRLAAAMAMAAPCQRWQCRSTKKLVLHRWVQVHLRGRLQRTVTGFGESERQVWPADARACTVDADTLLLLLLLLLPPLRGVWCAARVYLVASTVFRVCSAGASADAGAPAGAPCVARDRAVRAQACTRPG